MRKLIVRLIKEDDGQDLIEYGLLVGIITGTYSSVFIAAGIVLIWQGRKAVKAQPARPVATAPARKPTRRRAS